MVTNDLYFLKLIEGVFGPDVELLVQRADGRVEVVDPASGAAVVGELDHPAVRWVGENLRRRTPKPYASATPHPNLEADWLCDNPTGGGEPATPWPELGLSFFVKEANARNCQTSMRLTPRPLS